MSYQYVKNSRHNLKRRLLYIMGDKCCICGYNKCTSALEFHHVDPTQKDFGLGTNTNIGFNKAKEEIKKCILVCSNCHREIHEELINITNIICYDEKRAEEMQQEVDNMKTKTLYYCKDCGTVISAKAERCSTCNNQVRRVTDRPSREELKDLIRNVSFLQIGKQFGVSDNTIRKWCTAENLPKTKKEIKTYSDEEWSNI